MSFAVREGKLDVVIAAGPRTKNWPSVGVRSLSVLCAEMGLSVGQLGGDSLMVRGVIPLPGTGGLVLAEDIQKRIHRIHARAIVRLIPESTLPNPFPGWRSQGMIPLSTAEALWKESPIMWDPATVILGTGNRALRFGSQLLESGVPSVFCVEINPQWGAKRFAGWEVERRHFEMLGGKLIEAKPLQLIPKGALLWQLRLQDSQGIRVLEVGRVVSAGPFRDFQGVREYPTGSLLFELDQTACNTQAEDREGWALEEERGKWLAGRIVKNLVTELGSRRKELDHTFNQAKNRLKRYFLHRDSPFTPSYQGKWITVGDSKKMKTFSGVPQKFHKLRPTASIECFEEIPCHLCQTVCPTSAIHIGKVPRSKTTPILDESACISCGKCLVACPSKSIPLIRENEDRSTSQLTLTWRGAKPWTVGEFAILVNRRGENLGSARITNILDPKIDGDNKAQLVQLEVPTHLLWEARGLKRNRSSEAVDESYLAADKRASQLEEKIEITLNGEKRLVRDRILISTALFEIGQSRPNDVLYCKDGSCGLCQISVDGVKKMACQTRVHRGMAIRIPTHTPTDVLCPCVGVSEAQVLERLQQGSLQSPEAILAVTHVGEGKCHGQLCMGAFKRMLLDQGLDVSQWIDWRFPWSDWILTHN